MKAILVIDMPDEVSLDEWFAVKIVVDRLKATEEELMQGVLYDESKVFKFVPLRPLPQKKKPLFDPNHCEIEEEIKIMHEIDGYNRCIDEIVGETE